MPRTGYIDPTGPLREPAPSVMKSGEDPGNQPEISRLPEHLKGGAAQRMHQASTEHSTEITYQAVREAGYTMEEEAMVATEASAREQEAAQAAAAVSSYETPIERVTGGAADPSLHQAQGPVPEQETGYIVDAVG